MQEWHVESHQVIRSLAYLFMFRDDRCDEQAWIVVIFQKRIQRIYAYEHTGDIRSCQWMLIAIMHQDM